MNKLKDYKTTDKGEWREFELGSAELKVLNKIMNNIEGFENACKEFKELNPNSPRIHNSCSLNLRDWFEHLSMSISIDKGKKVSVQ